MDKEWSLLFQKQKQFRMQYDLPAKAMAMLIRIPICCYPYLLDDSRIPKTNPNSMGRFVRDKMTEFFLEYDTSFPCLNHEQETAIWYFRNEAILHRFGITNVQTHEDDRLSFLVMVDNKESIKPNINLEQVMSQCKTPPPHCSSMNLAVGWYL